MRKEGKKEENDRGGEKKDGQEGSRSEKESECLVICVMKMFLKNSLDGSSFEMELFKVLRERQGSLSEPLWALMSL